MKEENIISTKIFNHHKKLKRRKKSSEETPKGWHKNNLKLKMFAERN